jgi:hypothetical protein
MDEATLDHKRRLLAIYQDNLRELEIQAARFGANRPLIIINEIKEHRRNIDDLRVQLTTNAEEVTFDKILVSIEKLRQFRRIEILGFVYRSLIIQNKYHQQFGNTAMLSLIGVGLAYGLDGLYRVYNKYRSWDNKSVNMIFSMMKLLSASLAFVAILQARNSLNKKLMQEYQELLDSIPGDYFQPDLTNSMIGAGEKDE